MSKKHRNWSPPGTVGQANAFVDALEEEALDAAPAVDEEPEPEPQQQEPPRKQARVGMDQFMIEHPPMMRFDTMDAVQIANYVAHHFGQRINIASPIGDLRAEVSRMVAAANR